MYIKHLGKEEGQIDRDVRGEKYLLKVSSPLYHFHYSLLFH